MCIHTRMYSVYTLHNGQYERGIKIQHSVFILTLAHIDRQSAPVLMFGCAFPPVGIQTPFKISLNAADIPP